MADVTKSLKVDGSCLLLLVVTCFTVRLLNTRNLDSQTLVRMGSEDERRIDSTVRVLYDLS